MFGHAVMKANLGKKNECKCEEINRKEINKFLPIPISEINNKRILHAKVAWAMSAIGLSI